MKLVISILAAPLLLAALIAGGLFAWNEFLPHLALGLEHMLIAGVLVFCAAIVLYNHVAMHLQIARWRGLSDGLKRYEREVSKRFETLSSEMGRQSDLESLKGKLRSITNWHDPAKPDETTLPGAEAGSRPDIAQPSALGGKVIPIQIASKHHDKPKKQAKRFRIPSNMSSLLREGRLQIYLQPSVYLQERSVHGYEVLARLELNNGRIAPASVFLDKMAAAGLMPKADKIILSQTISLLRSLKRRNEFPRVFWHISPAALNSKSAFKSIMETLVANDMFKKNLMIEISPDALEELNRKQRTRLQEIREAGFGLSLENCQNLRNAAKTVSGGMFNTVKIPVSAIENSAGSGHFAILQEACRSIRADLIVTHVEREHEVIQLIDEHVSIGQGYLFSEPKKPVFDRGAGESVA